MDGLVIREASEDQAEKLIDFLNIIGSESDNLLFGANEIKISIEQEKNLIRSMKESREEIMLVGMIGEEIVSVAALQGYSRKRISHRGNLSVSVKKKYYHNKIGTRMIEELIKFAKSIDITVIELEVKKENTNAIALYEKMGFQKIGMYKNFMKINGRYYDGYLMNLYLD